MAVGKKTGRRTAFAGLVALAGFVASDLVKELTMRPRPLLSLHDMRLLVSLPHSYASPSGHATSAFASASGAILAANKLLRRWPLWCWAMLALATAIAYSRIYVGVHYPRDVAAGVILGIVCGWIGARWTTSQRQCGRLGHPEKPQNTHEEISKVEYQLKG